jgi:DNA polymerase-1
MPPPSKSKSKAAKPAATAPAVERSAVAAGSLKAGDHVFLVDGSGYIFRAYHALPPLTRKSVGLQIIAVLGFCNFLW